MRGPVQVTVEVGMMPDELRAGRVHCKRVMRRQTTGQGAHQLAPAPSAPSAGPATSAVRR